MKVLIKNKNWSDQGLWIKKKSFNCILFWNIYSQCRGINFAIPHALFKELYWAMLIKIYSRQNQIIVSLTIPRLGKLNTKKASSCIRRNFWRRHCLLIAFGNGAAISYLCCSLYASLQTNEMSSLTKYYLIGCKIKNMFSGPRGIVFEEIRKDNHSYVVQIQVRDTNLKAAKNLPRKPCIGVKRKRRATPGINE